MHILLRYLYARVKFYDDYMLSGKWIFQGKRSQLSRYSHISYGFLIFCLLLHLNPLNMSYWISISYAPMWLKLVRWQGFHFAVNFEVSEFVFTIQRNKNKPLKHFCKWKLLWNVCFWIENLIFSAQVLSPLAISDKGTPGKNFLKKCLSKLLCWYNILPLMKWHISFHWKYSDQLQMSLTYLS